MHTLIYYPEIDHYFPQYHNHNMMYSEAKKKEQT